MTAFQKVIKYCALAFAVFLIVVIIGGFISLVRIFCDNDSVGEMKSYAVSESVKNLEIDLSGTQLEIRTGSNFSVESNHKYLKLENTDGLLSVKEERKVFGFSSGGVKVIITVPENFSFGKADIYAGAGTVKIDNLTAENISLELGAGEARMDSLTASAGVKIEGGAGELTIGGGELANLDFDMGVGEVNMESRLTGNCFIDYGVGELDLTLVGKADDYRISLDKGVGEATIDGQIMHDEETYGSGDTSVEIDGGVGELHVSFEDRNSKNF